jgi:hypothetical protein
MSDYVEMTNVVIIVKKSCNIFLVMKRFETIFPKNTGMCRICNFIMLQYVVVRVWSCWSYQYAGSRISQTCTAYTIASHFWTYVVNKTTSLRVWTSATQSTAFDREDRMNARLIDYDVNLVLSERCGDKMGVDGETLESMQNVSLKCWSLNCKHVLLRTCIFVFEMRIASGTL